VILRGVEVLPSSYVVHEEVEYGLTCDGCLVAVGEAWFAGERDGAVVVGPADAENAAELRERLPWLRPRCLGLGSSFGFGDRLGVATPGHVRALRSSGAELAPIFAQQSIREMERSGRTPQEVVDDATWGLFAAGWREPWGADADHLKTAEEIDRCVAAGFTFFTLDPSDHVGSGEVPGECLGDTPEALAGRYSLPRDEVLEAAAKYGAAVAHAASLYRHLATVAETFEVEVSVDETPTPTTPAQHIYIAGELRRLGVDFVSLAPRFVGSFEKGIDYVGDVDAFTRDFAAHAELAERLGPYKLSLHSGSDKFSIYPALAGPVHVKTSGTSYLEALRTVSRSDPALFDRIYERALSRYEADRAGYHVSGELDDAAVPDLDRDAVRQILHVTFGSVLGDDELRAALLAALRADPEAYERDLERHFATHLQPFATIS
jgi:tagaturonate epimerase